MRELILQTIIYSATNQIIIILICSMWSEDPKGPSVKKFFWTSIGRYKNIHSWIHSCIECRQKWRQNFKNPSFVKGFEIGFSKSVLFRPFQNISYADPPKGQILPPLLDPQKMYFCRIRYNNTLRVLSKLSYKRTFIIYHL